MQSLTKQLGNFIDTINQGPSALNSDLFCGPVDRIMLGLKAHANTINHARLIALEETFPRARNAMGEGEFNRVSQIYCETDLGKASNNNQLGAGFAAFLANQNCDAAVTDLVNIEWSWLNSYHAPEALALELGDLGKYSETDLLALQICRHPAAYIVELRAPISSAMPELLAQQDMAAVLISRADFEVRLTALTRLEADIFGLAKKNASIGNLLAFTIEQVGDADPLGPMLKLIGAGALAELEQ